MTTIKIEGKPAASAANALTRHAEMLYSTPGSRRIGIVELARTQVLVPDAGEDKDPAVNLRIAALEIASPEQEEHLRQAMLALYLHRTARGTLDEAAGTITLDPSVIERTAQYLHGAEAARLRTGLHHWADYAVRVMRVPEMTLSEARHEIDAIATGLQALMGMIDDKP